MPRNASGTYTLPIGAFVPGGLIKSSDHNSNYSDIATALTQSLATTGVSTMTGQIKAAAGTVTAPGYAWGTALQTGFYLAGADQIGWAAAGIQGATFNSDQTVTWAKGATFGGTITATSYAISGGVLVSPPIGAVVDFAGSSAPGGWLLCFGQAVSRTTYSALFAVVSTTFGVGDGSTTFNLPDYRGRIAAGVDNMGGGAAGRIGTVVTDNGTITGTTMGSVGGSSTHVQTSGEIVTHNHAITDTGHVHNNATSGTNQWRAGLADVGGGSFGGGGSTQQTVAMATATTGITINNNGSSTAMAWLQPTIMMNKIIFAGV